MLPTPWEVWPSPATFGKSPSPRIVIVGCVGDFAVLSVEGCSANTHTGKIAEARNTSTIDLYIFISDLLRECEMTGFAPHAHLSWRPKPAITISATVKQVRFNKAEMIQTCTTAGLLMREVGVVSYNSFFAFVPPQRGSRPSQRDSRYHGRIILSEFLLRRRLLVPH